MISIFELTRQSVMKHRNRYRRGSVVWCIAGVLCVAIFSLSAPAQTLFPNRDTIPDISRYRTAEECMAAVTRVVDSVTRSQPDFSDTMPPRKGAGHDTMPSAVVAIADKCVAQFNPDSVVLTGLSPTYKDWMQLYLIAKRDDAAARVAQRRIAMAREKREKTDTSDELYDVLLGVMNTYGDVRPLRWNKVQETGSRLDTAVKDSFKLYVAYNLQFMLADLVGDTAVRVKMAERVLAVTAPKTSTIGQITNERLEKNGRFNALTFLTRVARMDSLKRSPDAYIAISRDNWTVAGGGTQSLIPGMIGESAEPLEAEFWFSSKNAPATATSDSPRPTSGKVSLIVFLRQGCNNVEIARFWGSKDRATFLAECEGTYSSIRRLGQRFPSLEITVVSRTSGYTPTGPMTPSEEAATLQKWWLDFHQLPATLAVANTPFFRLTGFDRRRIDESVSNDINYLFEQSSQTEIGNKMAYLIDTNGKVIHSGGLSIQEEQTLKEMLDVIMQRGK